MSIRSAVLLSIAVAYGAWRLAPVAGVIQPIAPAVATTAPFEDIASKASGMSRTDRADMREAYMVLSRSVAADPLEDPVFVDTAAVRRAHRAALLMVWKGVLANKEGEVAGLREALEGAVAKRIGNTDIPMNPTLRADAAKAFEDIAKSF